MDPEPTPTEKKPPRIRTALASVATLFFSAIYLFRPDWAQTLTWWPLLAWTPCVLLPYVTLRPQRVLKALGLSTAAWFLLVVLIKEPSWTLLLPPHPKTEGDYRVVSLNIAAGTNEAAEEAMRQDADIVLLQEVSSNREFETIAAHYGYEMISYGPDDAVFIHPSRTISAPTPNPAHEIDHASATILFAGRQIRVTALRLHPPIFRLDWWSPDCWREYTADLGRRRARLSVINGTEKFGDVYLFGGDFNATNPRIVNDTLPEARESQRSAGRGWPGTGTNDFPMVRVDQIWASPGIEWTQAYVQKTKNSDHRMVIADFQLTK